MYGVIINQDDGYVVKLCVILDEDNQPKNYELKEDESIIQFETHNPTTIFIKAKWNGTEWIEGATEEEIAEWQKQQNQFDEPNTQDTLNAQLLKDNASIKVEINNQKSLNSQLLLEIAKLKGGTTNV